MSSSGQSPRVSVLLLVHNPDVDLFMDAVDSILRQSLSEFELVIVDDGSTNGLLSLLESLGKKDPRVRIYFRPWLGLVQALNFGLRHCRGPFHLRIFSNSRPVIFFHGSGNIIINIPGSGFGARAEEQDRGQSIFPNMGVKLRDI